MSDRAKLFVGGTVAAGATVLELALSHWTPPDLPRYLVFFLLALVASTWKIRLPGMTTTLSPSFVFVLVGIADFSLAETMVMGIAATMVQCAWKPKRQPNLTQVLFNVSNWAVSIGVAYWVSHSCTRLAGATSSLAILLSLGACLFFGCHVGLLALVLYLAEEETLREAWRRCFAIFFPFYLAGTVISTLVCVTTRAVGWQTSLPLLPAAYLIYLYCRPHVERPEMGHI
jgi:hypothetical protein